MDDNVKFTTRKKVILRCANKKCIRFDINYSLPDLYVAPLGYVCLYCGTNVKVNLKDT